MVDTLEQGLDRIRQRFGAPGMAVSAIRGADVFLLQGFGLTSAAGAPVGPGTRFPIASLTKSFTAAAIAALVEAGEMAWDDPLSRWLPELRLPDPDAARRATVADALAHRTGMAGHDLLWFAEPELRFADLIERLPHLPMRTCLRGGWEYCNMGYVLAGEAAARAAGADFESLVRSRVLAALAMGETAFDPVGAEPQWARPHSGGPGAADPIAARPLGVVAAAGGLTSTAEDLLAWLRANAAGDRPAHRPAGPMPADWFLAPPGPGLGEPSYGLGWVGQEYRGRPLLHHAGNIDGFSVIQAVSPQDHVAVFAVANRTHIPAARAAALTVIDSVRGDGETDWAEWFGPRWERVVAAQPGARRAEPEQWRAFVGEYHHSGYNRLSVGETHWALGELLLEPHLGADGTWAAAALGALIPVELAPDELVLHLGLPEPVRFARAE